MANESIKKELQRTFTKEFTSIIKRSLKDGRTDRYMAEEFQLKGTLEEVTIKINDTDGGFIRLNTTVPDLTDGSWTGKYYTDYPITLTAEPKAGYEFIGWSGSVNSQNATIEVDIMSGGIVLEAVFEKAAN